MIVWGRRLGNGGTKNTLHEHAGGCAPLAAPSPCLILKTKMLPLPCTAGIELAHVMEGCALLEAQYLAARIFAPEWRWGAAAMSR